MLSLKANQVELSPTIADDVQNFAEKPLVVRGFTWVLNILTPFTPTSGDSKNPRVLPHAASVAGLW